ncbi:MAG: hypothetical protein NTU83_07925, partial [Candidatus Hydrogenedentes bacterium]|nr:hypothetical protein [Candidatus Hydrogenedentota bacterium]
MIPSGGMTRGVLIGLAALGLAVVGLAYAQQSATQPQPTPELSRLRSQLQQNLKAAQQGTKQPAAAGTAAARGAKAGKTAEKPGGAQVVQGGQPGQGGPPGARAGKGGPGGLQPGGPGKGGNRGQDGGGSTAAVVRTLGTNNYDPIADMSMEYGDVPDVGEPMTLNGPLAVKEFLETLSMATNWNVIVTDEAQKVNLQFWITDTKPRDALEIFKFHDLYYEYKAETKFLLVMTKLEYLDKKYGSLEEYEVEVKHATADSMESRIGSLMSTKGRAVTDPRTGHIYVWDTQANIEKMKETVEKLDVPQSEEEFTIKHADIADMETILNTMLSPSGTLVSDQRTARILVRDSKDAIEQMKSAVDRFDVALEAKIFPIKYANVDNLTDSVESVLSARGKAQVDPHTNTLIVTDVPGRQDIVAQLVEALDRKLDTRTWVLNYIDAETVSDRLENLVPEEMGDITVDDDVHQLTVSALTERIEEIDTLIKSWDVKRRQVQI